MEKKIKKFLYELFSLNDAFSSVFKRTQIQFPFTSEFWKLFVLNILAWLPPHYGKFKETKRARNDCTKPDHVLFNLFSCFWLLQSREFFFFSFVHRMCLRRKSTIVPLVIFKRKYRFLFFSFHKLRCSNSFTNRARNVYTVTVYKTIFAFIIFNGNIQFSRARQLFFKHFELIIYAGCWHLGATRAEIAFFFWRNFEFHRWSFSLKFPDLEGSEWKFHII